MTDYRAGLLRGPARFPGGIHEDLVPRLSSAARFAGEGRTLGARFERAFDEGDAAGRERGLATSH